MKFSANLGFLWNDRPLPEAIRAAKAAGFDAVECHWPYETPVDEVKAALRETGLPMVGLNTRRGDVGAGDNGLSAIPGRDAEARAAIDEAIAYATAIGTPNIHVMAGFVSGAEARATFAENLAYACTNAAPNGITILIEPLNKYDAPGYFLTTTDQALAIIEAVQAPNLKLMFDCYHVQLMEGDLTRRIETLLPWIGHFQFASVPDRGAPDHGEINYAHVFEVTRRLGYDAPLGAEYKPGGNTDHTLGWLNNAAASLPQASVRPVRSGVEAGRQRRTAT
ncbi:hydroxypyruvate isomerase family protein [Marinovum algicola]|uniref:hydroxypyruvate isomerase family protein n=1 Tax=Marinovum algicola TaxID=42444 RepID=UPI0024BA45CF|nr:TIM barrel protein [Marinovum algicola]